MKVRLTEIVDLNDQNWNKRRLEIMKANSPQGRVAVTDEKGQTFIAPLDSLEFIPEEVIQQSAHK